MPTIGRWIFAYAAGIAFMPFASADPPVPRPGVTSSYETGHASIEVVYSTVEDGHKFIAYAIEWKGASVVVSDPLGQSDYKVGDTITFMAQKIDLDRPGPKVSSLSFTLLDAPSILKRTHADESDGGQ